MTIEQMIARQQEIVNAARAAGRNMTREESAEFESLQRSIDAARAAGAGIAHGGQSSTPAAAPTNNNGILAGKMVFRQHIAPYTPAQDIENILDYDTDALASAVGGK